MGEGGMKARREIPRAVERHEPSFGTGKPVPFKAPHAATPQISAALKSWEIVQGATSLTFQGDGVV
jgi:hypothetical protein